MNLHIDNLMEWAVNPQAHKPTEAFSKKVAEEEAKAQRLHDLLEKRGETDAHPHAVA